MSKQNKIVRARNYADGVKDHVRRVSSQQMRCAKENGDIEKKLGDLSELIVKGTGYIDAMEGKLAELKDDIAGSRKEFDALRERLDIRTTIVGGLSYSIATMASIIQNTADRLGIDLSGVEPAEKDEDVKDAIQGVEAAGEKATADTPTSSTADGLAEAQP